MGGNNILFDKPATSEVTKAEDASDIKFSHQRQIADAAKEMNIDKIEVAKLAGKIEIARENLIEFDAVADLEEKLEAARKVLAQAEANSKEINDLKDAKSKAAHDLRESKYALSMLLVRFMAKYNQRSVSVTIGEEREINVKAEIGKVLEKQQVLPL